MSSVASGKLKEWSLVLYGTSMHPYILRDKERSIDTLVPTEEEEYDGMLQIQSPTQIS